VIERWIVDNDPSPTYPIYTRGNIGEVYPLPVTPLTWTIGAIPASEHGWRDALVRFGAFTHDEFSAEHIEILGCFGGYGYLNVSVSRLLGVRTPGLTPEQIDYSIWGEMPGVPPYEPRPGDDRPDRTAAVGATLQWILTTDDLPELRDDAALMARLRADRPDFSALSDIALVDYTRERVPELRRLFANHLFITYCATVPIGIIQSVSAELGDPTTAMRLVAGIGDVDSAAPSVAMWAMSREIARSNALTGCFDAGPPDDLLERLRARAGGQGAGADDATRFLAMFDRFLYDYGSRGPNEWETSAPSWETRPELALAALERMRLGDDDDDPAGHHHALAADREALGAELADRLDGEPETRGRFLAALRAAQLFLAGRERTKTTVIRLVNEMRVANSYLAGRLVERGALDRGEDYAMLRADELDAFLAEPAAFSDVIRRRAADYATLFDLDPPFVVDGAVAPLGQWARRDRPVHRATAGETLTGIPGCPGRVTGRARVVLDPMDPAGLEPGDILVAPITDPAWTPLFVPAGGVVVDVGAQISHAVIVSRELGIPCVVSVIDASRRIPDGAVVTVDGTAGTVVIEDVPAR
jgi:pyruvate,water dikinase